MACAIGVFFIWSSFLVISRFGLTSSLTPFDLSALRFMVAGALVLPFARKWWPRHLSLSGLIVMSVCGPGALYSVIMYIGLASAPVAYAGVFANGSLPLFSALLMFSFRHVSPRRNQVAGIMIILVGSVMLSIQGLTGGGDNVLSGMAFFLLASAVLSVYLFGVHYWRISPRQALALVTVPNALIYLPIWAIFLPSGLAEAEPADIAIQAIFQGLGPGFLAVLLFATASIHLGSTATAGFAASVPAGAAILAMPVLGELPTPLEWTGIITVTLGLALSLLPGKRKKPAGPGKPPAGS